MSTIFQKIINKEAPAKIFHETDDVIVFADNRPKDQVHLLIVPKVEYPTYHETPPDVLSMLNQTAKDVAEKLGIGDHYRLVVNNGYGQEIFHIHYHFMSNRGADKLQYQNG
ncbi:HIT domain-containing protein [candidate division GN15 bacterium]|nr:HIT domain-containing protein [candidate division GN15 bacterium]